MAIWWSHAMKDNLLFWIWYISICGNVRQFLFSPRVTFNRLSELIVHLLNRNNPWKYFHTSKSFSHEDIIILACIEGWMWLQLINMGKLISGKISANFRGFPALSSSSTFANITIAKHLDDYQDHIYFKQYIYHVPINQIRIAWLVWAN